MESWIFFVNGKLKFGIEILNQENGNWGKALLDSDMDGKYAPVRSEGLCRGRHFSSLFALICFVSFSFHTIYKF